MTKPRCSATVYGERQSWQCVRQGVVERHGKLFCKQHDPECNALPAEHRQMLWTWGTWDDKPNTYTIVRRTAKGLTAVRCSASSDGYPQRFLLRDMGVSWFNTEFDAWVHRVTRVESQIARFKRDLQDARTQLGMAQSRVAALKRTDE